MCLRSFAEMKIGCLVSTMKETMHSTTTGILGLLLLVRKLQLGVEILALISEQSCGHPLPKLSCHGLRLPTFRNAPCTMGLQCSVHAGSDHDTSFQLRLVTSTDVRTNAQYRRQSDIKGVEWRIKAQKRVYFIKWQYFKFNVIITSWAYR